MNRLLTVIKTAAFIFLIYGLVQLNIPVGGTGMAYDILDDNRFIDDVGNEIHIEVQPNKIVSLSSTHTENIFALGGEERLFGVSRDSNFPYEALNKIRYDLTKVTDLDKLIDDEPDLVLIEPIMNRSMNRQVSQMEAAGILVVSLMPEHLDEFDGYILKLGMILGREKEAVVKLDEFNKALDAFEMTPDVSVEGAEAEMETTSEIKVFVEASQNGYVTPTDNSLVGNALRLAGIETVNGKTPRLYERDQSYPVSDTWMTEVSEEIGIYITLKGGGYSGSDKENVYQNPVLADAKAVRIGKVIEMPGVLVGQYTFRYVSGVRELQRVILERGQVELQNQIDPMEGTSRITRGDLAILIYHMLNVPTYTLMDDDYYEHEKYHHTYGAYMDVKWSDDDFDAIESVTMLFYMSPVRDTEGNEWFDRDSVVDFGQLMKTVSAISDTDMEAAMEYMNLNGLKDDSDMTIDKIKRLLSQIRMDSNDRSQSNQ